MRKPLYPHIPRVGKPLYPHVTPKHPLNRITDGIRKALLERPSRLTHGYTSTNAFWIDDLGNIIQYNKIVPGLHTSDAIAVHSHMAENVLEVGEPYEQTFNAGDLFAIKWQIQHGCGTKSVVLTNLTTYDYIEIPPAAQGQFLKLGMKRLSELAESKYGEGDLAIKSWERDRMKLRKFASDYGLIYMEKQPWVVPPEVLRRAT